MLLPVRAFLHDFRTAGICILACMKRMQNMERVACFYVRDDLPTTAVNMQKCILRQRDIG